jgi:hypothetical protein
MKTHLRKYLEIRDMQYKVLALTEEVFERESKDYMESDMYRRQRGLQEFRKGVFKNIEYIKKHLLHSSEVAIFYFKGGAC